MPFYHFFVSEEEKKTKEKYYSLFTKMLLSHIGVYLAD